MDREDVKRAVSMDEVLRMYGIEQNRNKMICCPFHGEKHPSMKIYRDGYKCFACNAYGDIFDFVMEMDHCDFPTAFRMLGGEYEDRSARSALNLYRAKAKRENLEKKRKRISAERKRNDWEILKNRFWVNNLEPFSDEWCRLQNKYTLLLAKDEELLEKGKEK